MPAEKKRPRGLKSSALAKSNKKTKTEELKNTSELPENAKTVVIDKIIEEGDEVGEAAALLESAMEKLESDPEEALALLRGTIHESDRILRNTEESLPALFYYTYGSALYELGRLTEDEEFEPYLEAAEERLNEGLALADTEMNNKIHLALAKIWLAKAASAVSEDSNQVLPELSVKALDTLDEVMSQSEVPSKTIIELADIVQNHGDLYESLESRDRFRLWAETALEKVLKDEPNHAQALSAFGLCKLSYANYLLDNIVEEEEEEEERKKLNEQEEKALQVIRESKKYFESAHEELVKTDKLSPQIISDLAETYLNEANLILDEEEQLNVYKKVVKKIKEAQSLIAEKKLNFVLPEALTAFLEEFEQEE
ncbi:nuclear pore complex subunit Nro1-domain-containing protein [Gilbertella persicaria]|uniref:nuclear pore complex subunit Nro1-domain-containing protein n=1 Tax=Gilbertella persicaria TaxID=101096 RepID=UPI00221E752F|nr:nuclear pore complex subunit Nro1-domain-containing protein [Gilbertella persicaria]KAI8072144.1 nuclear pore complex subunit Nro1-domain-containing protein [Gilbertella persicaria]